MNKLTAIALMALAMLAYNDNAKAQPPTVLERINTITTMCKNGDAEACEAVPLVMQIGCNSNIAKACTVLSHMLATMNDETKQKLCNEGVTNACKFGE